MNSASLKVARATRSIHIERLETLPFERCCLLFREEGLVRKLYGPFDQIAPMRAHVTKEDVGNTAAFLASPLAAAITGATVYVDNGYHAMGM